MRRMLTEHGCEQFWFWCPGCKCYHEFQTKCGANGHGPEWQFDGNVDKPTFAPSLLVNPRHPEARCHLFLRAGRLQFLNDCHHHLAGQTVDLVAFD
ncbi:MAG: anaerobic dehydrogenase [Phycisphaera sp.]|nr:anaerobic dehydrogenase [Phycisphaera sp.]